MQETSQLKDGKGGVINARGANMGAINGADGGDGTVTINEVDSVLNYPEKQITLHINDTYQIDQSKVTYTKLNDIQTDDISVGNISFEIASGDGIELDANGMITAKQIGTAKVKITDITNEYSTYLVVNVIKETAKSSIKQGDEFTVALKENGTVWAYGTNENGELGNGTAENSNKPKQVLIQDGVELDEIIRIDAAKNSAIALNKNGEVYTWGKCYNSETEEKKNYAEKVSGLANIKAVSTSGDNFLSIDQDGNLYIWGKGYNAPTKVDTEMKFADVDGNLLLGENGRVYNRTNLDEPLLFLNSILEVSQGENHNLFVTLTGKAYGLGKGTQGQIGDAKNKDTNYSSLVIGENGFLENILEVSAGNESSMALGEDRKSICFWK